MAATMMPPRGGVAWVVDGAAVVGAAVVDAAAVDATVGEAVVGFVVVFVAAFAGRLVVFVAAEAVGPTATAVASTTATVPTEFRRHLGATNREDRADSMKNSSLKET
jgi:hypothetical protein